MPRELATLDRSCYVHQSNHFPDDREFSSVCQMVKNAGFNLLKVKASDGSELMGTYDRVNPDTGAAVGYQIKGSIPAPWAITSPERWAELAAIAFGYGLKLIPWCVPHGTDLTAELYALLQLAAVSNGLIELDIEDGKGFWVGPLPGMVDLVKSLYAHGVTVWIDCDTRPTASSRVPFAAMAPFVARWLSQDYWSTFDAPEIDTVGRSADLFAMLPANEWGSIFPHDGPKGFHDAAIEAAARDAAEIGFWLLDYADSKQLEAWQGI
jgi:hypothetical protein